MTKEIRLSEEEILDILRSHLATKNNISVEDIVNLELDSIEIDEFGGICIDEKFIAVAEILEKASVDGMEKAIALIQQKKESAKTKILMILNHLVDEAIALGEAIENREIKREKVTYIKHRIVDTLIKENTSNTPASQASAVNMEES